MKYIVILLYCISFTLFVNGQTGSVGPFDHANGLNTEDFNTLTGNPGEWSKIMGVFYEFDDIRFSKIGFEGSSYLFDDWENKGAIYAKDKKLYTVSNINFNIEQEKILTQLPGDSTFVYDFNGIDKIIINGRAFKSVNSLKANSICEVVYETDKVTLLKSYSVRLIEASPNPMINRKKNKIKRTTNYFISRNGNVEPFKLNKSSMLNLAGEKQNELRQMVKKYKLSYKKEDDVKKMLRFIFKA